MGEGDVYESVRQSFDGDQLRVARELRRMTQTELARGTASQADGRGVTPAAISQFELAAAVPSAETIMSLVTVLELDPQFLTVNAADAESHLPAFFRSLRTTPAKDRKRARNIAQLVHRLAVVVAGHVDLATRDVPKILCDPFSEPDDRRLQAEQAANEVRRLWHIDAGPISNVVETVERHGVVCTRLRFRDERVDAFSVDFSDYPVAVLVADKAKWDRSRFDTAHELGHLVMHAEVAGVPEAEKQASEFAAAFLMPASDICSELPARADWRRLLELKRTWGASIAALLYRARTLGAMSEKTYVGSTKVMAARGWKRHEPLNRSAESPQLLRDMITRASRIGVAPDQLRQEAAIPTDLFGEVCGVLADPN